MAFGIVGKDHLLPDELGPATRELDAVVGTLIEEGFLSTRDSRQTPPALQRSYVYYNCGFRNIKLQERRNTGKRREIQGGNSNTGKGKEKYRKIQRNTRTK